MHALQVHMPTSGIVTHYIGKGGRSPNPKQIHCLKRNSVFDLCDFFRKVPWHETRPAWTLFIAA